MQNIAIIGAGFMGRTHAEAYGRIKGAKLVAVVDADKKRAIELSEHYGCVGLNQIDELVNEKIDVIDICVPTPFHKSTIENASYYSKNIICEKPIVLEPNDIDYIKEIVEKNDITFMLAQVIRFSNGYKMTKKLIDEGIIGKIRSIVCTRRQKAPRWSESNWINKRELSGGPSFDLIIHELDYINWILGRPEYVLGTELMDGENCLHVKAELLYKDSTATIFGSLGMPEKFAGGSVFSTIEVLGKKALITFDSNNIFRITTDKEDKEIKIDPNDAYEAELKYFIECVEKGEKPAIANIYQAKAPIEIACAIVNSSRQRNLIKLI